MALSGSTGLSRLAVPYSHGVSSSSSLCSPQTALLLFPSHLSTMYLLIVVTTVLASAGGAVGWACVYWLPSALACLHLNSYVLLVEMQNVVIAVEISMKISQERIIWPIVFNSGCKPKRNQKFKQVSVCLLY